VRQARFRCGDHPRHAGRCVAGNGVLLLQALAGVPVPDIAAGLTGEADPGTGTGAGDMADIDSVAAAASATRYLTFSAPSA
jgi:hypothetical protein